MIRLKDIRMRLDREPFTPFTIRGEDGRAFKVLRRNLCFLTRYAAYVGVPDPKAPRFVKRMDYCPFDYAIGIEELKVRARRRASSTESKRNGKAHPRKAR